MMVHRTRADQAERVWLEFTSRWPTVASARAASPPAMAEVLKPLGLDWRIANIMALSAKLPDGLDPTSLRTLGLRGVGHYAESVVSTISAGGAVPIVDANVVRIYERFFGLVRRDSNRRNVGFHQLAASLLPMKAKTRRDFFWGLMDFGSAVCKPRQPKCGECPLSTRCVFAKPMIQSRRSPRSTKPMPSPNA